MVLFTETVLSMFISWILIWSTLGISHDILRVWNQEPIRLQEKFCPLVAIYNDNRHHSPMFNLFEAAD